MATAHNHLTFDNRYKITFKSVVSNKGRKKSPKTKKENKLMEMKTSIILIHWDKQAQLIETNKIIPNLRSSNKVKRDLIKK